MPQYDLVKTITLHFNCVEAISEADAIALVDGKGIFDADSYGDTNTFVLWSSEEESIT